MGALRASPLDGPQAVLVDGGALVGQRVVAVALLFVRLQGFALPEGHLLVEDGSIARLFDVLGGHEGQPEQVVGDAGAHPPPRGGMPPVQHVARLKLVPGRAEDVPPRQAGPGVQERHHILELIPEAVGAAGLVEGAAPPDAGGERLIEQPGEDEVHGRLGGLHFQRSQEFLPEARHLLLHLYDGILLAEALHQRQALLAISPLPQEEGDLLHTVGLKIHVHLEGSAGVDAGGHAPRKADAMQGGGILQPALTPQELRPVGGEPVKRSIRGQEGDPLAELGVVGVARQQHLPLSVVLRHHVELSLLAEGRQHPLGIVGRGDASGMVPGVLQAQPHHLDWRIEGGEEAQLLVQPVAVVLELRVAPAVAHEIGQGGTPGQGRRRPALACLLIAQIERLRGRVGDGIVPPGGEPVLTAVGGPGVAEARFRDEEAELGIGDDVDPGGRRPVLGPAPVAFEVDHVFLPVGREAAEAVVEVQLGGTGYRLWLGRFEGPSSWRKGG